MIKNYRLIYLFVVIELKNIYIIYKSIEKGTNKNAKEYKNFIYIPLSLILRETDKCFLINF